ncbi:MAG TPA: hypothetical protein VHB77_17425 [Planctomycetaceae bacterium]|nr:hypothetical protein [Planctomycetaceae bacterium]
MDESLILSAEHQKALRRGDPIPVVEAATQTRCVVVREDIFDRLRKLLADFDPQEVYPALDEVMREDWSDPRMAEYDDYESHKK